MHAYSGGILHGAHKTAPANKIDTKYVINGRRFFTGPFYRDRLGLDVLFEERRMHSERLYIFV